MATYPYWQHFLVLESDFALTARYVEFSKANFTTYSTEFVKLLLAVGSEIDIVCKVLCEKLGCRPGNRWNICEYRKCLTKHSRIAHETVLIRRYDLRFQPWFAWHSGTTPSWWVRYNDVKHERHQHFPFANLENCANAIAALFVLVIYCHKAEASNDSLEPLPMLLGRDQEPGNLRLRSGYQIPDFT